MDLVSFFAQPNDEETKERPCVKCATDQPPAKMHKKSAATLVREANAEVETSM